MSEEYDFLEAVLRRKAEREAAEATVAGERPPPPPTAEASMAGPAGGLPLAARGGAPAGPSPADPRVPPPAGPPLARSDPESLPYMEEEGALQHLRMGAGHQLAKFMAGLKSLFSDEGKEEHAKITSDAEQLGEDLGAPFKVGEEAVNTGAMLAAGSAAAAPLNMARTAMQGAQASRLDRLYKTLNKLDEVGEARIVNQASRAKTKKGLARKLKKDRELRTEELALSAAVPGAERAANVGHGLTKVSNALTSTPVQGAAGGAAAAAVAAPPEERADAAKRGALMGGGMGTLGQAGMMGRTAVANAASRSDRLGQHIYGVLEFATRRRYVRQELARSPQFQNWLRTKPEYIKALESGNKTAITKMLRDFRNLAAGEASQPGAPGQELIDRGVEQVQMGM